MLFGYAICPCETMGTDMEDVAMLTTERFGYQIYTENFGVELEDLVGEDADYIEATLPARIRDAFSIDDRILGERNYKFEVTGDTMLVTFDVDTVYGSFSTEVQI